MSLSYNKRVDMHFILYAMPARRKCLLGAGATCPP
jgi:hypothetical protein